MPEAKHYEDSLLDAAYVYTDLSDIKVDPEDTDAKNLIKILSTKRRSDITNIKLPDSVYLHRTDYGSVRSDFSVVLRNILDQTFDISGTENMPAFREKIDGKLEIYPEELTMPIVADEVIDNLDAFDKEIIGTMQLKMDDGSVDRAFNAIIRSYMVPYKNFARSKSIVCGTLYSWFGTAGIYQDETSRIITCSTSNQVIFKQIFEAAKIAYDDLYKDEMAERRKRELDYFEFEIPATDDYTDNHTWIPTTKNVMERYFRQITHLKPKFVLRHCLRRVKMLIGGIKTAHQCNATSLFHTTRPMTKAVRAGIVSTPITSFVSQTAAWVSMTQKAALPRR